jgi:uncharacterized protein DUF1573
MKLSKLLLIIAASLFLGVRANAQLKWEQMSVDLHPTYSDTTAVAHFKYENIGTTPIHFNAVRTSCGCTAAKPAKEDVAPGEKGEITATLQIGDRIGVQQKTVTVETNDPKNPTTALQLKATIPALLEVQPAFVYWDGVEPLKPKTISVHAPKDSPVTKVTVTSSDPAIPAKVVPGPSPKDWTISIEPKDRAQLRAASLTIQPDYPAGKPKLYYASARVTNAPGSAPTVPPTAALPPAK